MPSNDPKKQRKMNIKKYSIAAGIMSLLFGALAYSEPPKQQFPEYPQNGAIATESGAANANGQNASGVQGNVQGNIQGNTVHGDLANTKVQGTLINNTYSGTQITFQGGTNAVNVNTGTQSISTVAGNQTNITGEQANFSGGQTNIAGNQTNVSGNQTNIAGNQTRIAGNQTNNTGPGVQFNGAVQGTQNNNTGAGTQIGTQINYYNTIPPVQNTNASGSMKGTKSQTTSRNADEASSSGMIAHAPDQGYAKGLRLSVWQLDANMYSDAYKSWRSGKIPAAGPLATLTIDTPPPYSHGVISKSRTLQNYMKALLGFVWEGFVQIKAEGHYNITVELYYKGRGYKRCVTSFIFVDDELKAQLESGYKYLEPQECALTVANVDLTDGMHKVQFLVDCNAHRDIILPYDEVIMRIRIKGPDDDEPVELKATDFYYPLKKKAP